MIQQAGIAAATAISSADPDPGQRRPKRPPQPSRLLLDINLRSCCLGKEQILISLLNRTQPHDLFPLKALAVAMATAKRMAATAAALQEVEPQRQI